MPINLLSTPTQLRTNLKRLITASERIDVFVPALSDPDLIEQLAVAAEGGAEVNLTTNLDEMTAPEAVERLREAGANVGVFEPAVHRRRPIRKFGPGVIIFDSEAEWWTAALVGSFSGTTESFDEDLVAATLVRSESFQGDDEAGAFLLEVLNWGDSIHHASVDDVMVERHRRSCERGREHEVETGSDPGTETATETRPGKKAPAKKRPARKRASSRSAQAVEVKPQTLGYVSPLSWQEIRRCDWGTFWHALLEADKQRGPRFKDSLCGPKGWLFGIDAAHRAYMAGPDAWWDQDVAADLLGGPAASGLLGRVEEGILETMLREGPVFRQALRDAVERCITEPTGATMREVLAPIVAHPGVTVPEVSRVLAAAAPDRFFSLAGETMQLRLSSIVGFDLTPGTSGIQDHLTRYADAVEVIRAFPWAEPTSAERTTDHVRESDAWEKRVALLGCLIC